MPGPRLSPQERIHIEVLWGQGKSIAEIAADLDRHRATIYRELKRNNVHHGANCSIPPTAHPKRATRDADGLRSVYTKRYSAHYAQIRANRRARRRKYKLRPGYAQPMPELWMRVHAMLLKGYSPKEIAARLRAESPDDPAGRVCAETIYQCVYWLRSTRPDLPEEEGGLRRWALARGHCKRKKRRRVPTGGRGNKPWRVGRELSRRDPAAAERTEVGHYEGDLIVSAGSKSALITVVERKTRYLLVGYLPDRHDSRQVVARLIEMFSQLPRHMVKSLTWDCGVEMARVADFEAAVPWCETFFCDPHSPWQRGSNENINGMIRRKFPKSTDFRRVSEEEVREMAEQLNQRWREVLGWASPAERWAAELGVATDS